MAAKALLQDNPNPNEEDIRFALAGNLCRCTGYDKSSARFKLLAQEMRGALS